MSVVKYNQDQIDKGFLTVDHISFLVMHWQRCKGLTPDAKAGPNTIDSIERAATEPDLSGTGRLDTLGYLITIGALGIAGSEIGCGEDPELGNNRGADVDRYREHDGTGKGPGGSGSWCAAFASYCLTRSCEVLGVELPFKTSRGAKALVRACAKAGRVLDIPEPGALISWDRGKLAWQGHVGIVQEYDPATDALTTIEGNKNRRGLRFAKVDRFRYPRGLWRQRLAMVATIAPRGA